MTNNINNLPPADILHQHIVSVVYVNYHTFSLLKESVRSLEEHCTIPFEIIIVDNASGENERSLLEEWLSQKPVKNVRLIFSEVNAGFAAANNLAAKQATGKYLFFLNPDTLVLNDVIGLFYNHLERSGHQVGACGGNLLKPDLSPNDSYGNFPGILLELCNIGLGLSMLLNGYYKKHVAISCTVSGKAIRRVPYIVGADLFVRAEPFRMISGFDENYFMYYEETDLLLRFQKLGLESYILPEAKIIHYEGGAVGRSTAKVFNYNKFQMLMNSKMYYYRKWSSAYMPFLKAIILLQIVVQYLKGKWGSDFMRLISIYRKSMSSYPTHGKY